MMTATTINAGASTTNLVQGDSYIFRTANQSDVASAQYSGQYVIYIGTHGNGICEVRTLNGYDLLVMGDELS